MNVISFYGLLGFLNEMENKIRRQKTFKFSLPPYRLEFSHRVDKGELNTKYMGFNGSCISDTYCKVEISQ